VGTSVTGFAVFSIQEGIILPTQGRERVGSEPHLIINKVYITLDGEYFA
jgi:hypothetical protein